MCYNAEAQYRDKLRYALLRGDIHLADEIQRKLDQIEIEKNWLPLFFTSGFSHPELMVFTNAQPMVPQMFSWGLIPAWARDLKDAGIQRKKLLNARIETMFDLPSFKNSARTKRCLVYLDAFYEYHDAGKKKYPFRISMANGEPMVIGGLWGEWTDKHDGKMVHSFAIVTTEANDLMRKIHNLPAHSDTARMPVILTKAQQEEWLIDVNTEDDIKHIQSLGKISPEQLKAFTVAPLIGKAGVGNKIEATQEHVYEDLIF
ncbi:MAG TPA: SOS response-associated peptidase [Bacteroidia bacterium]|nr:SOS response-associated peptidase [Bacteroidia bacterium]